MDELEKINELDGELTTLEGTNDAEVTKAAYDELHAETIEQMKKLTAEIESLKKANLKLTAMTQVNQPPKKSANDYINELFNERSKK